MVNPPTACHVHTNKENVGFGYSQNVVIADFGFSKTLVSGVLFIKAFSITSSAGTLLFTFVLVAMYAQCKLWKKKIVFFSDPTSSTESEQKTPKMIKCLCTKNLYIGISYTFWVCHFAKESNSQNFASICQHPPRTSIRSNCVWLDVLQIACRTNLGSSTPAFMTKI